jgi:F-type H+-transporting ATPase subunit c
MKAKFMLITILVLLISAPVWASDAEAANGATTHNDLFLWSIIIGTACLTLAAVGGAWAQSMALQKAVDNIGRNPAAADSIRGVLIIGLALIESLVIYVLLIDLILFFVKWGSYTVG